MDPRRTLESAGGIITQRDPRRCIVRLRTPAGLLTPAQLEGLLDAAAYKAFTETL